MCSIKEAAPQGLDPALTNRSGGYMWANQIPGVQLEAQKFEAQASQAQARTVYDVEHHPLWGGKVSGYLFTKSLAAGAMLAGLLQLPPMLTGSAEVNPALLPAAGFLFLLVTAFLLVADLKRPERFWYILRYPNWSSWLARGAVVITVFGVLNTAWLAYTLLNVPSLPTPLLWAAWMLTAAAAAITAGYTGWLFNQAKGRALWLSSTLWVELVAHAVVAGLALLVIGEQWSRAQHTSGGLLAGAIVLYLVLAQVGHMFVPGPRRSEHHRARRLMTKGPFAARQWTAIAASIAAAILLFWAPAGFHTAAAGLVLAALYVEEDVFVRAGQALPIH